MVDVFQVLCNVKHNPFSVIFTNSVRLVELLCVNIGWKGCKSATKKDQENVTLLSLQSIYQSVDKQYV